jgi:quinoprotein glucose dehydrogenase
MGGPLITGSGLVFIAAAVDNYLRAFDLHSGRELWKGRLPAGGQATPMSYTHEGRQYIVIAAGGHKVVGTKLGEHLVAYALPAQQAGPGR